MASETGRSSGAPTWIFAVVAVAGIVAFLFWISMAAQPAELVAVTEGDGETEAVEAMTGEVVTLSALANDTDAMRGREVVIERVPVAASMGQQAFWIDLPNQQPFLIKLGRQLSAAGVTFSAGDTVDIAGTIIAMTDSVVADWLQSNAIAQSQEAEAQFATSFLEASTVRPARR